ncbi:MAG: cysteine hydrolase [Pseudomonadota bacterium]
MLQTSGHPRPLIVGKPALIVIDIQGDLSAQEGTGAIPEMPGFNARMALARRPIDMARAQNIPVIFIQEVHRPDQVDFGRELDGAEDVHCIETDPDTAIAAKVLDFRPTDYLIRKRRYSAFFGTDFEILLKGLKIDTLLLCGGLTDVCVHYTFVDGHQSDYFCRASKTAWQGPAGRPMRRR